MVLAAVWHGYYPMYFIAYFQFAIVTVDAKYLHRAKDSLKFIPAWIRTFFAM